MADSFEKADKMAEALALCVSDIICAALVVDT